ncbi:MAG: type II toxin-antitoxin system HipA family toxin [Rhodoferax sp.]
MAGGTLNVWMNGQFVGEWSMSRNAVPTFKYDPQWTHQPYRRALSLSLPITAGASEHRGDKVVNYFDNLLPDSKDIRSRLSSRFKTKSSGAFDLLQAIGRDCVGAVQLLPVGTPPDGWDRIDSVPLTETQVERILISASTDDPLGQRHDELDDFRISIAGAQEKTALLRYAGQWHLPKGATPTTHILKLPLGLVGNMRADMGLSVENEWLCAQILRELGLNIATTEMATFGGQKVLVVERFDRRWQGIATGDQNADGFVPAEGVWIARLPQEDFCQVTGTSPEKKYEQDGGPSIRTCLDHLAGSQQAELDRTSFVLANLAFWLLAATDGHGKNFSIFHHAGGNYSLTPLYDVLSAWPIIGEGPNLVSIHKAKLAMAVRSKNAHYKIREIQARHWLNLAQSCGASGVWPRMVTMVQKVDAALTRVQSILPQDFPAQVWDAVQKGVRSQAALFQSEVKLL